jgi:uncharacterized RDD family membrane protein YckC
MNRVVWLLWAVAYHLLTLVMAALTFVVTVICSFAGPEFGLCGIALILWFVYVRFAWYWKPFRDRKKRELGLL